jgi:TusA-related sulfurtransferase
VPAADHRAGSPDHLARPGDKIVILADDPAVEPDLAAWCRMRGHELISSEPPRFVVRKG